MVLWAAAASADATAYARDATAPPAAPPCQACDIVVIARRLPGAIPGPIAAEASLDANAIAALGASSLADILAQITPFTSGSQARAADGPVLLVNGRRIASFSEVQSLPPEAIARVDVLPEEAALRMGFSASVKPVNIVLKPHYAATTGEIEGRAATWGGRHDVNAELNVVRIAGDSRLTLDMEVQRGEAISEAKRGIIRPLGGLAASSDGIVASAGGGALAPLAAAYLSVPATGRALGDFAATVPADTSGGWRTLTPATRDFTANATLMRPLGGGLSLAANARFERLIADDLLGPAIAMVTIPVGGGSPFAVPVHLARIDPALAAAARHSRTDTLHLGTQLAGNGRWQWTLAVNVDRTAIDKRTMGGVDARAWQAAIDAGALADPFALPATGLLAVSPGHASASRDTTVAAEGYMSGPVLRLPAGNADVSLRLSVGRETLAARSAAALDLRRDHLGAQATLGVPLLGGHSMVGALDAGLNAGIDQWSDVGGTHAYGADLTWKPRKTVSLLLGVSRDAVVPTMQQIGAPPDSAPAVPLYDFGTGQSTAVASVTGGEPGLVPDRRAVAKAELTVKASRDLTLTGTITDITDHHELFAFGGWAPAFVAAFPARFQTDAAGEVITADMRPFTAAREHRDELRLAAAFSHSFSPGTGPSVGGKSFGGNHAFGAYGSMVQASLTDTVRLTDSLMLTAHGPGLDLVGADPLGDALRVARHRIEAQISATHAGFGLRANAVWTSGGLAGAGTPGALTLSDRFAVNARFFWFPASRPGWQRAAPWLRGVRFLLAIDNLFGSWQHVADMAGQTPLAYQRGLLDPIGRTVRFSIRKTFD